MKSEEDLRQLKEESRKFDIAWKIIKSKRTVRQWLEIINPQLEGIQFTEGAISKLRKANKYSEQISPYSFPRLIPVIDQIIVKEFNKIWDVASFSYVNQNESSTPTPDLINLKSKRKLNGLSDFWIGYSYNLQKSERHAKSNALPPHFINKFIVEITNENTVKCNTQKTFLEGNIELFNDCRIYIKIASEYRRITMMANIGHRETLSNLDIINLAYVDSGVVKVKCGLVVLKRQKEKSLPAPNAYLVQDINDLTSKELGFLMSTQLLANEP